MLGTIRPTLLLTGANLCLVCGPAQISLREGDVAAVTGDPQGADVSPGGTELSVGLQLHMSFPPEEP